MKLRHDLISKSGVWPLGIFLTISCLGALSGCGQKKEFGILPATQAENATPQPAPTSESFSLAQEQTQEHKVQIDLLWVIDNSASMDPSQDKLRQALSDFGNTYLTPKYDIKTAVITTDTYLANPIFRGYLSHNMGGFKVGQVYPYWGPGYAQLSKHDGPIPAMCEKSIADELGDFYYGWPKCWMRNSSPYHDPATATEHCLHPDSGESSITQCVNTAENDLIHTHRPVISTLPAAGDTVDSQWQQRLINDFIINTDVGTSGNGYERGLGSLIEFLNDNETGPTPFFRPGSQRAIIFLSDEDDQTIDDQKAVQTRAGGSIQRYSLSMAYTTPCPHQNTASGIPPYTLSFCVDQDLLIPVSTIKGQIDQFFTKLDQGGQPGSYFVTAIVGKKGSTVHMLQQKEAQMRRTSTDETGKLTPRPVTIDQDVGRRYIKLVNDVGGPSMAIDIGTADYRPILDRIGKTLITKSIERFSTFNLGRAPADPSRIGVQINHGNGTSTPLSSGQYELNGSVIRITDRNLLQSMGPSDRIEVTYNSEPIQQNNQITLQYTPDPSVNLGVSVLHANGSTTSVAANQYSVTGKVLTITDPELLRTLQSTDRIIVHYQPIGFN